MQRSLPAFLIVAGIGFVGLAVCIGFSAPVAANIPPPPAPPPPTFVPYHIAAMQDDSQLAAVYGAAGTSVLGKHPEIVRALQKIDPGFDDAHIAEAANMRVAEYADDRQMLLVSGCDKAGCAHGGWVGGYVTKAPGGKTPTTTAAFLIETNDPVHLQGITYGEPNETYSRPLLEELARITAAR